jgi:hypothetical protein
LASEARIADAILTTGQPYDASRTGSVAAQPVLRGSTDIHDHRSLRTFIPITSCQE